MALPPLQALVRENEQAKLNQDQRAVAETAYALAMRYREDGDFATAQYYAVEALEAARLLPSTAIEDVVSERREVGGVPIPDLFHDGVVKSRLEGLLPEYSA